MLLDSWRPGITFKEHDGEICRRILWSSCLSAVISPWGVTLAQTWHVDSKQVTICDDCSLWGLTLQLHTLDRHLDSASHVGNRTAVWQTLIVTETTGRFNAASWNWDSWRSKSEFLVNTEQVHRARLHEGAAVFCGFTETYLANIYSGALVLGRWLSGTGGRVWGHLVAR